MSLLVELRFTKDQNLKPYHRLQHIYAWFLYGLLTISLLVSKDWAYDFTNSTIKHLLLLI